MASASQITSARNLLSKYGVWIRKYRGGMPAGWMAAIMDHESGGNFGAAGDASLGEVGFYQIAAYVPPLFGLPASARLSPESNVAIASLEYALEAVLWKTRYPSLVRLGTADSWKLARLSFAVGRSGGYQLADLAKGYLQPGKVYDGIVRYVSSFGAPQLGSQSPDKVISRVLSIPDQWAIGQAVDGSGLGPPTLIPAPPAGPYRIPANAAPYFSSGGISPLLLLLGAGLGVVYYLRR